MNELSEAQGAFLLYTMDKEEGTMKYLKIFTDFLDVTEQLTDGAMGRLFRAMLRYARDGAEPRLKGKEGVAWAVARQSIDREAEVYERKVEASREAGRRSGEARRTRQRIERTGTNVNETNQDKDKEKEKDKDKDKDKDISFSRDAPSAEKKETRPTLDEVIQFTKEAFLPVDAEHFFNYYEANGWRVGQNPIQDWKAALKAWARNAPVAPRPGKPAKETSDKEVFRQAIELHRRKEAKRI